MSRTSFIMLLTSSRSRPLLRYTMAPLLQVLQGPTGLSVWLHGRVGLVTRVPKMGGFGPNPEGVPEPESLPPTCAEGILVSLNPYRL